MPAVTIRVLAVLAVGLGLWLLDDAMTFALYAPTPTRSRGCYTAIEQWLGVTHPRDAIRQAELWTGLGLAAGMPIVLAVRWMRRAW